MLNYDSLTQIIIFTAIVNVTGDLILQKFILKLVFFLLTHYVPMLITYIYIYIYARFGTYNSAFFVTLC